MNDTKVIDLNKANKENLILIVNQLYQIVDKQAETINNYENYFKGKNIEIPNLSVNIRCCDVRNIFLSMKDYLTTAHEYSKTLLTGFICHFLTHPVINKILCEHCVKLVEELSNEFHIVSMEITKTLSSNGPERTVVKEIIHKDGQTEKIVQTKLEFIASNNWLKMPAQVTTEFWKKLNDEERVFLFKKMAKEVADKNKS